MRQDYIDAATIVKGDLTVWLFGRRDDGERVAGCDGATIEGPFLGHSHHRWLVDIEDGGLRGLAERPVRRVAERLLGRARH
jgi:hypothetical protein